MPDRGLYKANGPKIAQLRGTLTPKEFAAKCSMSVPTLESAEASGEVIQGTLEKIAAKHPLLTWKDLLADPKTEQQYIPHNSVKRGIVTPGDFLTVDEAAHAQQTLEFIQKAAGRKIKYVLLAVFDSNSIRVDVALSIADAFLIDAMFDQEQFVSVMSIIHYPSAIDISNDIGLIAIHAILSLYSGEALTGSTEKALKNSIRVACDELLSTEFGSRVVSIKNVPEQL